MMRLLLTAILATAGGAAAQTGATRVPLDGEIVAGGVHIGCTGVGQTKNDPHWRAYPVRVEFADTNHAYLADEALSVSDASGKTLATVSCEGPWILLRPEAAGAYGFKGWLPGRSGAVRAGAFHIPATGQSRVVLTFPTE